jgi:hypothetical protein
MIAENVENKGMKKVLPKIKNYYILPTREMPHQDMYLEGGMELILFLIISSYSILRKVLQENTWFTKSS